MKYVCSTLLMVLLSTTASAKVWIVAQDGSGDFTKIQPAIDVASDGDVILIRDGIYDENVVINKGIALVGTKPADLIAGVTIRHLPIGDYLAAVAFRLPPGAKAILANVTAHAYTPVVIADSPGRHILSRVEFRAEPAEWYGGFLIAARSNLVFLEGCTTSLVARPSAVGDGQIWTEQLQLSCSNCKCISPERNATQEGSSAFQAVDSAALYLAESTGTGGKGGVGYFGGAYCDEELPGGRGGAGVEVDGTSSALVAGRSHLFQGGDGGDGGTSPSCPGKQSTGGPGGDGVRVLSGGVATVSGVTALGGLGGDGDPDGAPGQPYSGNVNVLPTPLPTSLMSGSCYIGGDVSFEFFGQLGDNLVVLLSDQVGILKVWGTEGFPLMAIPGGRFLVRPFGTFDATQTKQLYSPIPNDAALRGYVIFVQGIVTSPRGIHLPQITNLSLAVIGERGI